MRKSYGYFQHEDREEEMAASHVRYQVTSVLHSSAHREEDREEEMAASHVRYQVTPVLLSAANREEDREEEMAASHVRYQGTRVYTHQPIKRRTGRSRWLPAT